MKKLLDKTPPQKDLTKKVKVKKPLLYEFKNGSDLLIFVCRFKDQNLEKIDGDSLFEINGKFRLKIILSTPKNDNTAKLDTEKFRLPQTASDFAYTEEHGKCIKKDGVICEILKYI